MIARVLCILLLCVAAVACTQHSFDSGSYFPLAPGLQWSYRITTEVAGKRWEDSFAEHNASVVELDGLRHTVRVTDQGTRYYVREDSDGVFRAAKRTIVEPKPRPDVARRWILRKPFQIGSNWSQETHPYVLRRLQPYEEQLAKNIEFKMAYQIAALNDTVEVPAGRFEDCIRVEGEAQLTVYADGRTGYQDININTSEWYAPGVGLVKLVRTEPLDSDVFAGGSIVFELESFDR